MHKLNFTTNHNNINPNAQFVFCIDVRSEPMRRKIESYGVYQTFGFAGFFGVPAKVHNEVMQSVYSSCPVLLKPKNDVKISTQNKFYIKKRNFKKWLQDFYVNCKHNFATPLALVDFFGMIALFGICKKLFKFPKKIF